jgi:glutamine cyclotransferase
VLGHLTMSRGQQARKIPHARHSIARRAVFAVLSFVLVAIFYLGNRQLPTQQRAAAQVPVYGYQVVHTYPHDRNAFTQGLLYRDGFLYEGTGLNGRSTLRKVRLETGEVLEQQALANQYFGEGITDWGRTLLQLTWQSQIGFVFDLGTFNVTRTFSYEGEGWGLTHDVSTLILSDGTSRLRFFDPSTFEQIGSYTVRDGSTPVAHLNELEYVRGEIYANVWQTDRVVRIALSTGQVIGWIDLAGLLTESDKTAPIDVLNGIAYDAQTDRLFVTGKLWPKLFEITLVRR